jgi:hypothetical protein
MITFLVAWCMVSVFVGLLVGPFLRAGDDAPR